MKILLTLPRPLFPPDTGGKIRSLNIFARLAKRAEIHAVSFAASDAAAGKVYNVGGDERVSLADLARLLVELNGGGEWVLTPYPADRRPIDIGDYYADFVRDEAQALGYTLDQVRNWTPPAITGCALPVRRFWRIDPNDHPAIPSCKIRNPFRRLRSTACGPESGVNSSDAPRRPTSIPPIVGA